MITIKGLLSLVARAKSPAAIVTLQPFIKKELLAILEMMAWISSKCFIRSGVWLEGMNPNYRTFSTFS
jgi:hypothetical protein